MYLYELKLITFVHRKFWVGTYRTFGIINAITLVSPLFNTIINWKYRKYNLVFSDDAKFSFKGTNGLHTIPTIVKGKPNGNE